MLGQVEEVSSGRRGVLTLRRRARLLQFPEDQYVAGSLAVDRWQGDPRVQLRIIDVASADPVGRMG